MKKSKGILQKIATVSSLLSVLLALGCGAYLYRHYDALGPLDPVTGSLEASIFFFLAVGVVLFVIGRSNVPNFKFDR